MASITALCPLSLQSLQEDGQPLIGAKIYIFESETTTPKTVFKDYNGQVSHPRPILTNAQGRIPPIYVSSGLYRVRILRPDNTPLEDVDGLVGATLENADDEVKENYPLTDENSILRTGDVLWSYRTGPRKGFTPCNGGTIGQETSGASNIASGKPSNQPQPEGSAFALFRFLWENDPDLPVYASGVKVQRGATALSDWDYNRTMGVPDLRGRTVFGLDTMSNISANIAQITTKITTTKGSTKATIESNTSLCVGMLVCAEGIPDGTLINEISGLTVTLSATASETVTQKKARFSVFPDAEKLGSAGGKATHTINQGELAPHKHNATSSSAEAGWHSHSGVTSANGNHQHAYEDVYLGLGSGTQGGANFMNTSSTRYTSWSGDHAHSVTVAPNGSHNHAISTVTHDTGGGYAHNNMPPALLGTFYMKL